MSLENENPNQAAAPPAVVIGEDGLPHEVQPVDGEGKPILPPAESAEDPSTEDGNAHNAADPRPPDENANVEGREEAADHEGNPVPEVEDSGDDSQGETEFSIDDSEAIDEPTLRPVNLADPKDVAEFIREHGIHAYDKIVAEQPVGLAMDMWTPSHGSKLFARVAESNFGEDQGWREHLVWSKTSWREHLVWSKTSNLPVHRLSIRNLPDGRVVARPESFLADDLIFDNEESISV